MSSKSFFSYASGSMTPEQVAVAFDRMPGLMSTALKRQTGKSESRIKRELGKEPGSVQYPVQWTSEKQRRAFFATDGFGRGIPTRRTHALSRGWRVDTKLNKLQGDISIYNTQMYERFVTGSDQQGFHKNTGWQSSQPILDRESARFVDDIRDTIFTVADDFAGVR
jgi:hypothetical protein